ncbi:uncharacterized protein LOC117330983 [Pecten maximus]|uniref:uncharacterized protein LOC117330983 n=1 Tax=Pecten maximus TaxID=6579 RepID=UPI00145855EE|nr:uncharacterized protein LOC117330983 [Pecten maximus]XP_033745471.1 uncharacterized protein LOC117330983 [Pecten maximus]
MPGVKRKASTTPGEKLPAKLKKQSTSVNLDRAIVTSTQKTSQKTTLSKIKESSALSKTKDSPKRFAGEKKVKKSLPSLPRFPTLVPTKPAASSGSDFVFNVSPASSPKKELNVSSKSSSSEIPGLRKETTTLIKTDDCPGNKASNIEKSVLRLSSGSYVGRIMNKDVDDQMLPSLESLAVYEQKQKSKTSDAPFTWDMTDTDSCPVRKSVYDVNAVLNLLDQENSPTKCSLGDNTSDNDSDAPPVLQAEVYDATSCEDYDDDAAVPTLTCMGTPSKSSSKSPRKMTGGPREVVFSFDTTGSMYNYMEEASYRMRELMNRVKDDMPGTRLAFVAHGDYYDLANDRYLIKWIDFGASVDEVDTFFENLPITHGGDADECYELVLRKVRESLSWTPGSQRSLVIIGDSDPHEPGYKFNDFVNDIDWRQDTQLLNEMGVRIYALQVGYTSNFYRQISQMTGGAHLRIENTDFTYDTLISICLREGGLRHLKAYEHEVRSAAKKSGANGGTLDLELERLFSSLKSIADNKSLKQRERENKLKARVLEMTTGPKISSLTKRPSEKEATISDKKKLKVSSKYQTKESLVKAKSSDNLSPQKLTKIKEKKIDKSKKKASIEKVMKVSKTLSSESKTQKTKLLKKEKSVGKKQIGDGKLKKVESKMQSKKVVVGTPKSLKAAKPRGRPRKEENSKLVGKSSKKVALKSTGRPRKTAQESKKLGRPVTKKEKTSKTAEAPKKHGKTAKKIGTSKSGKPAKVRADGKAKKTGSPTTTKKKEETSLKSSSSVVQRIVAAKLKRLGKSNANSKVKIAVKLKSAVKTKDKKSTIKPKSVTKTATAKSKEKFVTKKKLNSTKENSKRKPVPVKLSLKKQESKAKIAKLKSVKKIQDKKKAAGKGSLNEKKKTEKKVIKAKTATTKGGRSTSVQQKEKKKSLIKQVKKEVKMGKTSLSKSKKTPVKAAQVKKPQNVDKKKIQNNPKSKTSVKSPQKKKTSSTEPRENISGSKFSTGPLSNVKWSPWTAVISPKSNGADWSKSRGWCSGHSNEALYQGHGATQALYEAAVVPPGSNNKYAVTYSVGEGSPADRVWDCFNAPHIRQQVQRVVKDKGAIYVRRGVIAGRAKDSLLKAETYIKENFDYAWHGRQRTTEVRKEGFVLAKT